MSRYIATFHTHLSALLTCQRLTAGGGPGPDDAGAPQAQRLLRHLRGL